MTVTTWGNLRNRVFERLAEYNAGAAAAAGATSVNEAVVYARMTTSFRRMLDKISRANQLKLTSLQNIAYAASTESQALPAALQYRPIFGIERLLSSGDYEPLEPLEQYQDERSRAPFSGFPLSTSYAWMGSTYGYKVENTLLYVLPKPTEALTLRAKYFATIPALVAPIVGGGSGDRDNTPPYIPDEHLDVVALDTAVTLLREVGGNASLEAERSESWQQFMEWATRDPKRGPRFVLET